ncbi:hypothetical protein D9758_017694 [Tetrapyrgos nigripes]|uniref:G domain-containing protein n=1 Tax=Tetrapyrgos nigripes TaxID=182062 RepID=A0A8H5BTE0_9AGAR|nr:hypothetical protein D9758_017694 [Tetrapyrgos nigripes]
MAQSLTPTVQEITKESERIAVQNPNSRRRQGTVLLTFQSFICLRSPEQTQTGAGKTTLIKKAFNVETLQSSHNRVGISNIEEEIISKENDRFVIHDSQGYEPGDTTKFEELERFIGQRSGDAKPSDKIHIIWLCIATPYAGGRVLETGTESLLKSVPKDIAMVVVFTKYDELVDSKEMEIYDNDPDIDDEALNESSREKAAADFEVFCVEPLKRFTSRTPGSSMPPYAKVSTRKNYEHMLSELVRTTEKQITLSMGPAREAEEPTEEVSGVMESPPALLAMAQMVDTDTKIALVIRVGKQKYWRGLASSTHFPGLGLRACLSVLHKDIVIPWNINDPEKLLLSDEFESSKSIGLAGSIAGVSGAVAGPVAPIVAPTVFVGVLFAHWVYETYKSTPDTKIIEEYQKSSLYSTLSNEINQFIRKTKMFQYGTKDHVLEKLEELISLKYPAGQ